MKDSDIGGYVLREKLGEGVLGETWRAEDSKTQKSYAVKILDDKYFEGAVNVEQIFMGLENYRNFFHPNIADPITWGTCRQTNKSYIISEYVPGPSVEKLQGIACEDDGGEFEPLTLADILAGREAVVFDDSIVIGWINQMLDAFVYQASFGIHGNIKPSNVLIDKKGEVRIVDMGIVPAVNPDFFISHTHQLSRHTDPAGDIDMYLAPEFKDQFTNGMTQQMDVYAFGKLVEVMLKYLVTEKYPVLSKNMSHEQLKTAINNCTTADPQDRFEDFHSLEAFLTGCEAGALRSNRIVIFLLVMLLVVLIFLMLLLAG